jgi:hypothetical protein
MLRLLLWPVVVYVVWCGVFFMLQRRMLFPGATFSPNVAPSIPAGWEVWPQTIDTAGGSVRSWFAPGAGRSADAPGPCVMLFHGNAERIEDWIDLARWYEERGVSGLLVEYRGYGPNAGSPSQSAIVGDALSYHTKLCEDPRVDPTRIFFHGRSLGTGVACALAAQRQPAALVLESAFTSVASFAPSYGLPGFLARDPFRNDRVLPGVRAPLLLAHGNADTTVPMSHAQALARSRPDATFVELPCGHNDFPGSDAGRYESERAMFLRRAGLLPAR